MMLAETAGGQGTGGLLRVFEYIGRMDFPSRAEYVDGLGSVGTLEAVALVAAGGLFLVYGFRYFKMLVPANAAAVGALCGAYLGTRMGSSNMPLVLGTSGAVLTAALAWLTMRYAVGIMGALAGGLVGLGLWHLTGAALNREGMLPHAWAGGVVGMVVVGMLTFVLFRNTVMIFTAVQGAIMIVSGVCAVLVSRPSFGQSVRDALVGNEYLLLVLIGVPAVMGFSVQFATEAAKIRKKRKVTEKPPV